MQGFLQRRIRFLSSPLSRYLWKKKKKLTSSCLLRSIEDLNFEQEEKNRAQIKNEQKNSSSFPEFWKILSLVSQLEFLSRDRRQKSGIKKVSQISKGNAASASRLPFLARFARTKPRITKNLSVILNAGLGNTRDYVHEEKNVVLTPVVK